MEPTGRARSARIKRLSDVDWMERDAAVAATLEETLPRARLRHPVTNVGRFYRKMQGVINAVLWKAWGDTREQDEQGQLEHFRLRISSTSQWKCCSMP